MKTNNTQHIIHSIKHVVNSIKGNAGFTLVEMMVAVMIISISVVSLLTLISSNLFYSQYIRNEITANYLIQEASDYIKNERVNSLIDDGGNNWNTFVSKFSVCGGGCTIDAKDDQVSVCEDSSCKSFYYHEKVGNGNFYNYKEAGGVESGFKRWVKVSQSELNPNNELNFEVFVSWGNGNNKNEKSLKFSILNWLQ